MWERAQSFQEGLWCFVLFSCPRLSWTRSWRGKGVGCVNPVRFLGFEMFDVRQSQGVSLLCCTVWLCS